MALIALLAGLSLSCGKAGPPIPPARMRERTAGLVAMQRGASVILTWPVPQLTADAGDRSYIDRIDVYRLVERRDLEPVLDADDYRAMARVVGFLDRKTIEAQSADGQMLNYSDQLDLSGSQDLTSVRLRYAIRYVNKRGQEAPFSNSVVIEPSGAVSEAPSGLRVIATGQDRVVMAWDPPVRNVDGSEPASVAGYNIYRRIARRSLIGDPVNSELVTEAIFTDTKFRYGANYVYTVRAVSNGRSGLIESRDSEPLLFRPVDTFPPSSPDPVSIASAAGTISLFWPANPEPDVEGYYVYRSEALDAPDIAWTRITPSPIKEVTFHDAKVTAGRTYYYRVTVIDRFKNESLPSHVVSEVAVP